MEGIGSQREDGSVPIGKRRLNVGGGGEAKGRVQSSKFRVQRSEVRGQRSEVRGQRSEFTFQRSAGRGHGGRRADRETAGVGGWEASKAWIAVC